MVATATNIPAPALPATLEVNGQSMATPSGAVGIVGKLDGHELFVVRNGQTVSLRTGDWLLEGDRVVTSSAAEQALYFAGDAPGSLRRIQFARGADFKIRNGEIYTTALISSSMVTAAQALPQAAVVAGSDDTVLEPEASMAAEETSSISGLFGSSLALGAGNMLAVGGGMLALASLGGDGDSGAQASTSPTTMPSSNNTDSGNGGGSGGNGETGTGGSDSGNTGGDSGSGGAFSSGGAQLDALFASNPTGQTPPFSFADGGATLEGAIPVPVAAPASNGATPVDTLTQTVSGVLGSLPLATSASQQNDPNTVAAPSDNAAEALPALASIAVNSVATGISSSALGEGPSAVQTVLANTTGL